MHKLFWTCALGAALARMIPKATYLGVVLSVVTAVVGLYCIYGHLGKEAFQRRSN